jgi:NADPH2:quinone reductase
LRAALIQELAAPPVLAEMPDPERGPGDALVRITAACLNPVEVHINSGRFFDGPPRLPYVPGVEATGVVEEGEALAPGTRVRVEFVHPGYGRDGAIAEYAVAPETPDDADRRSQAMVFPLPDGVDDVAGAALGTSAYTALMVLERAVDAGARLQGAHVLVLAATGAVGRCAVQLARLLGAARVVAAGRDAARLERALELGADAAVPLDRGLPAAHLARRFLDAADGRLDVSLEPLWGEPARAALEALTEGGVHVNFGQAAGHIAELSSLPLRNRSVAVVGHSGAWTTPAQRRAGFERVHALASEGGLTIDVEELPLGEVTDGWRRLQRSAGAKLVVRPGDD